MKTKNILIVTGLIVVAFYWGYATGRAPTDMETLLATQQRTFQKDLVTMVGDYSEAYNLCERKYQYALKGEFNAAYDLRDQADQLIREANTLYYKYMEED